MVVELDVKKVKLIMVRKGINPHALALNSGLSCQALRNVLNETSKPKPSTIKALAKGLEVDPEKIIILKD